MTPEQLTRVSQLLKTAAKPPPGMIKKLWTASKKGADTAGKELESHGHNILGGAIRYTPHAAALYGAKKTWESDPVRRTRMKYQIWKMERAQRKAMERGGYR